MKSYYLQYLAFEVVVFIGIYALSKDKEIAAWFTLAMSNALTYSAVLSNRKHQKGQADSEEVAKK